MNLVEALERGATRSPGKGLKMLEEGRVTDQISLESLYRDAGQIGAALTGRGVRRGERVAIALPNSVGYAQALFGVLAAGGVAVPLPPPYRFASLTIHLQRISLALRRSQVSVILADEVMSKLLGQGFAEIGAQFRVLDIAQLERPDACYVRSGADEPAVVQYTSGTSGDPKGVVLTHANISANVGAIVEGLGVTADDVGCSWLPLFHDMGLIGHLLVPIASGNDFYLMRPEEFLRRPLGWLRAISEFRATISSAPSSAYAHCLRHITDEQAKTLDLSSWRVALNGAEAVDARVLRDFVARFGPAGFGSAVFLPVYGLAEAALAVAFPPVGRAPLIVRADRHSLGSGKLIPADAEVASARELISVGKPVRDTKIRVIGENGDELPEGLVGQIEVCGPSVTSGYEQGQTDHGGSEQLTSWIGTGDLGVIAEDELYIVGRTKETIVIFGQNYYASDIEAVAGAVPGVPSRGVLAAGYPDTEGDDGALIVFVEMDQSTPEVRAALEGSIRAAISHSHGISATDIFFVAKGRLERTSSGKLRRNEITSLAEECLAHRGGL